MTTGVTFAVSGIPNTPWNIWPPTSPAYSAGDPIDIGTEFLVTNDWSQPRRFRVMAQAQISNNSTAINLQAKLYKNGFHADMNFSTVDRVNQEYGSGTTRSVHKITLFDCPTN